MSLLKKITSLEKEAAAFGFQWETSDQIMQQIYNEYLEVMEHLQQLGDSNNRLGLQEEIGDLLHAVFSLCVFCRLDPQETLKQTLLKFERRLQAVKEITREQHLMNLQGQSFNELMAIWDEAKSRVG